MKRFLVILVSILVIETSCIAQDSLFVLHPVVGEMIDQDEKIEYLLFPEINDSVFKFCSIKQVKDEFYVNSILESDSVLTIKLNISEINQYKSNIDKLHEYYMNQNEEDSLKDLNVLISKTGNSFQIIDITIDSEKISNEARSNERLREDAERLRLQEQGIERSSIVVDFSYIKIKKKK